MLTQISHDAFARQSILREVVSTKPNKTCKWCGGVRKNQTLFQYYVQNDEYGATPRKIDGLFDSIDCMKMYHY